MEVKEVITDLMPVVEKTRKNIKEQYNCFADAHHAFAVCKDKVESMEIDMDSVMKAMDSAWENIKHEREANFRTIEVDLLFLIASAMEAAGVCCTFIRQTNNQTEKEKERYNHKQNSNPGWEKPTKGEKYYYIRGDGHVLTDKWRDWNRDKERYEIGNTFLDEKLAISESRRRKLDANLRRFAALNSQEGSTGYSISGDYAGNIFREFTNNNALSPVFKGRDAVEGAMAKFHEELYWFFTNYTNTKNEKEKGERE